MSQTVSIAIETSCRLGGVALGRGEELLAAESFDASSRHATQLVGRLAELLRRADLRPRDLREAYVSVGPGSFTGTRIGVTVARTLAQTVPHLRCVAVASPAAVAEAARGMSWRHLAVVLDAREGLIHATLFGRTPPAAGDRLRDHDRADEGASPAPSQPAPHQVDSGVMSPAELLARAPRPLMLLGEGLAYHDLTGDGVTIPGRDVLAPPHLPTAESVWRVGRRLARAGLFTPAGRLLPIYSRPPEAVRLWQRTHGIDGAGEAADNDH